MTSQMKLALIANAAAGRVRSANVWEISQVLRTRFAVEVEIASSPEEVRQLAHQAACHADLVVAFGGDGTASQVAAGLVGTTARFSVLAGGSTNHVARLLGFPLHPLRAARLLAGPVRFRQLDVGQVDGQRVLLFLGGIGIDAAIVRDALPSYKRYFAWRSYLISGLRHLNNGPWTFEVEVDGISERITARTVLVANGSFLVHPYFQLGPTIRPDDGIFDVVALVPPHRLGWLGVFGWAALGRLWRSKAVCIRRGHHIVIRSQEPLATEIDGDALRATTRLEIRVLPGALTAVVPAFTRGVGE